VSAGIDMALALVARQLADRHELSAKLSG